MVPSSSPISRENIAGRRRAAPHAALVAFASAFALATTVSAQERADPIATGTSRASMASARGLSSLYTNIGGLALGSLISIDADERIEADLGLLPIGIAAGSTYLNSSELNFVFDDKACDVFSDADRFRLGELLERDRLSADAAVDLAALRIRVPGIGALGLQYGHRIRVRMNFPEQFRRDVLGSGDVFAGNNRYDGTDVGGEWLKRLAVTLGAAWQRVETSNAGDTWLPVVGFGVSLSALEGVVHFDVDRASVVTTRRLASTETGTRRLQVDGRYAFRSSVPSDFEPARAILRPGFGDEDRTRAVGWGGSLGISAVILRRVRVDESVSVGNPLDPQSTEQHAAERRDAITIGFAVDEIGSLDWHGMNLLRSRTIDTVVTDERGGLTYEVICGYRGDLDTVGSFTTQLPTAVRLGAAVDVSAFVPAIGGDLVASAEAAFDLNDAIGSEGAARVSVGAQWSPWPALTLLSGMQFGGRVGYAWSLGADVRPFPWLSIAAATADWTGALTSGPLEYDVTLRVATHLRF